MKSLFVAYERLKPAAKHGTERGRSGDWLESDLGEDRARVAANRKHTPWRRTTGRRPSSGRLARREHGSAVRWSRPARAFRYAGRDPLCAGPTLQDRVKCSYNR